MGGKPRQSRRRSPRLRVIFTEAEAREVYDQLAKTWVGYGATRDLLTKLSAFFDKQLSLPGIKK